MTTTVRPMWGAQLLARLSDAIAALKGRPADASQLALLHRIETATATLEAKLRDLDHRLLLHDHFSQGADSTYLGNGRVLTKCVVDSQRFAFLVEADDLLLSPWFIVSGHYETRLTDFFVREVRPDSHCIDVGANFGYFTCLLARRAHIGKIIGIEPDQRIYELLRDNIHINGLHAAASSRHAAVSDRQSPVLLHRRVNRSGNTSVVQAGGDLLEQLGEPRGETFSVPGLPLDSLKDELNGRVDFIKIDVEGAEPSVIAGARELIRSNPQLVIVMEWSPHQIRSAGGDCAEFLRSIRALELSARDIEHGHAFSDEALLGLNYAEGIVLRRA